MDKFRVLFIGISSEFNRFKVLNSSLDWKLVQNEGQLIGYREVTIIVGDSGRRLLYDNPTLGAAVNRIHRDNIVIYL